ncbi:PB1 domain-containing protein [Artemisia annua]|uniref:PB1 domain-containing protein n=1 Tax=Artemisia annua TaxID=35608 RepID=A0A2U1L0W8_ARTAN|nr:PB1 domain-containing protein [Artemisia annua]
MEPEYLLLLVVFMAYILYSDTNLVSRVKSVFDAFDFQGESGLLQFWKCGRLRDPEDIGCSLKLSDHCCVSTIHDNRLTEYRMRCFSKNPCIGQQTNVGNWFAGRAAQTGVADHRTRHVVLNQDHQFVDEASGMGQLVLPVYFNYPGDGLKLAGIIEFVTTQPKQSYVADFNQIKNLLMMVNLASTYMGKMMKVKYDHMVKFTLPFSAKLPELLEQVKMRFQELENKTLCIEYEDTNHNRHSISSNQDLKFCIDDSILFRTTVIRMFVHVLFKSYEWIKLTHMSGMEHNNELDSDGNWQVFAKNIYVLLNWMDGWKQLIPALSKLELGTFIIIKLKLELIFVGYIAHAHISVQAKNTNKACRKLTSEPVSAPQLNNLSLRGRSLHCTLSQKYDLVMPVFCINKHLVFKSTMEPEYLLLILFMAYIQYSDTNLVSRVKRVFDAFDCRGESGLLQFWKCSRLWDQEDIGCSLKLSDHCCVSTIHDNNLMEYRMRCFSKNPRIGQETKVGNWFAGRAAQTGVADHRTRHVVLNQDHQFVDEASRMGQLVLPVYFNYPGAGLKLAGIIEFVTTQPKHSYVADFDQIQNLLMMVNLASTYMGKMIKVQYDHMVMFTLPFSAELPDLLEQVKMRFPELENKTFCIEYEDTNHSHHSISSNQDLKFCIDESV